MTRLRKHPEVLTAALHALTAALMAAWGWWTGQPLLFVIAGSTAMAAALWLRIAVSPYVRVPRCSQCDQPSAGVVMSDETGGIRSRYLCDQHLYESIQEDR